jgi:hypothetical protein
MARRGQHGEGAGRALHRPGRLLAGALPHHRALGQQRLALGRARHRTVHRPVALLERAQHPLVQHQTRAGGPGEDAADQVGRVAGGIHHDDGQAAVGRQRALGHGLVGLDHRQAGHREAGRLEGAGHLRAGEVGRRDRAGRRHGDDAQAHGGHPQAARATSSTPSA